MPEASELAQRVEAVLRRAGLPRRPTEPADTGGFGLQAAGDGDPGSPVLWVVWRASEDLIDEVHRHMIDRGDVTHPSVLHLGHIHHAMAEAILEILQSAGLDARMSSDDMNPLVVEVFAGT